MVAFIVYDDSTKQIIRKQTTPASTPPKQAVAHTSVVILDSEYGDYAVTRNGVELWDDVAKKRTTRAFTPTEISAKANT